MTKNNKKIRQIRVRSKIKGIKERPRISVFRSNKTIYAQAIDDDKKITLASAKGSSPEKTGEELAKKLKSKKIGTAVFDRGSYKYQGKIQRLADAIREGGIKI